MGHTPNIALHYLPEGAARGEDAINAALLLAVDPGLCVGVVDERSDPPGSPVDGEVYIVGENPTDDWSSFPAASLAFRIEGAWVNYPAFVGMVAFDGDASYPDFRFYSAEVDPPGWVSLTGRFQPALIWAMTGLRDGSPVYSGTLSIPILPNATTASFPHSIVGLDISKTLIVGGWVKGPSSEAYPVPIAITPSGRVGFWVDEAYVHVSSDFNASGYSAHVHLEGHFIGGIFGPSEAIGVFRGTTAQSIIKYDPTLNVWSSGGGFNRNHDALATSTKGAAGSYVCGGTGSNQLDEYSGTTDIFTARANRPTQSNNAPAVEDDAGTAFWFTSVSGGKTSHSYVVNTWTTLLSSIEDVSRGVASQSSAGFVLLGFGVGETALRRYNTSGDSYTGAGASHPNGDAIYDAAAFDLSEDCHVVGGRTSATGSATTQHHSYSYTGDAWTSRAALVSEIKYAGGAREPLLDRGYISQGTDVSDVDSTATRTYQVDTWITVTPSTVARGLCHGLVSVIDR